MSTPNISQKFKNRFIQIIAAVGLVALLLVINHLHAHSAGSATLSLSPNSGSHTNTSTFAVTINENSTDAINAVEADLTYDQAKLQFVSIDTSGSAFDGGVVATGGSGKVTIARAKLGSTYTGTQVVAAVSFKALAGSGSTNVSFASTSAIVTSGAQNVWNGSTTGGTYTLTTPATPPPSPSPTPSPTPTPTPTPSPSPSSSSTPTPSPSSSSSSSSSTTPSTTNTVTGSGYYVAIKVVDDQDKPVEGAQVTIDKNTSAVTDATGIASFTSISPGYHSVNTTFSGKKPADTAINVAAQSPTDVQQFETKLASGSLIGTLPFTNIVIGVVLVLLLGIGGWFLWSKMSASKESSLAMGGAGSSNASPSTSAKETEHTPFSNEPLPAPPEPSKVFKPESAPDDTKPQ